MNESCMLTIHIIRDELARLLDGNYSTLTVGKMRMDANEAWELAVVIDSHRRDLLVPHDDFALSLNDFSRRYLKPLVTEFLAQGSPRT